jgi:hypothetical protein
MDREAGELFQTADTVPGVSPKWSATDFRVTRCLFFFVLSLLFISMAESRRREFPYSSFLSVGVFYPIFPAARPPW